MTSVERDNLEVDVLTIDPDGYFTIRDFGGGKVHSKGANKYEFNFSLRGACTYNLYRLKDTAKIKMELVHGIPSICPRTSDLMKTEFQPHAPPTLREKFKDWFSPPTKSEVTN